MTTDFSKLNKDKVRKLIDLNPDSRRYFFTKADASWLGWLWDNGFLDVIKEKGADPEKYGYVTPELDYLVESAKTSPNEVVDIMLEVPITPDTFNSEVTDRFLWICGDLPADQVARIVQKIRDEKWVQLMRRSGHSGYEYKKMIDKLSEAEDYDTLLILAEALFAVRTREEIAETANGFLADNPFYLNDIFQTDIFEAVAGVDESHSEKALSIVSSAMKEIVLLGKGKDEEGIFEVGELFYLFNVDFFLVGIDSQRHSSYRDDVRNFAATLKELIVKTIGSKCGDEVEVERLFMTHIESLPFSRSMWRLRLFAVSLCPETFKAQIKKYLFMLFDEKAWSSLIMGAEYERLLHTAFFTLSATDRETYISKVFLFFGDGDKEVFYKHHGYELLSCIDSFLTEPEKQRSESLFGLRPNPEYIPEPTFKESDSFARSINAQAPVDQTTLNAMAVPDIALKLTKEWSPENIVEQDKVQDFHNPINAEGMGAEIQKNISTRSEEYIQNASLFFNRAELHPQYTYAFLQGIYDVIRQETFNNGTMDLENLIPFFEAIISSGQKQPFVIDKDRRKISEGWLANWGWIHNSTTDVLKYLLGENKDAPLIDFTKHKKFFLNSISYLLKYPNPTIEDNTRENGGDPFTTAINSVRGRAFQALAVFVYQDGSSYAKEAESRISKEVKDIYENLLRSEETYAIMFMFGHLLPSFYFRDKVWIRSLLPEIFPHDTKPDLYVASWEGYVSGSLYHELFIELEPYYNHAIKIKPNLPERRYFKNIDEGLATHIALAFMHFEEVTKDSSIFKSFWATPNIEQHKEFLSFIGRYAISRQSSAEHREANKISIEKLKDLWDWVLATCTEVETFSGFGFWMKDESEAFDPKWLAEHAYKTLEKSGGKIDWDYGIMMSLSQLATEAPESTLKILQAYLIGSKATEDIYQASIYIEGEVFNALKILYANPLTRTGTDVLIAKLLPMGNRRFWKLKEILPGN